MREVDDVKNYSTSLPELKEFINQALMSTYSRDGLVSITLTAFIGVCALVVYTKKYLSKDTKVDEFSQHGGMDQVFYPPLPNQIVTVLKASRLCFLATQCNGEPHLSLMNFSYYTDEDTIILTTRRDTKKFNQINQSPYVAVLIHDFPHLHNADDQSHGKSWSITLNGKCEVCPPRSDCETKYREYHLANNPDYKQFISGEDNAVVVVRVQKARMCDINDKVSYWDCKDGETSVEN